MNYIINITKRNKIVIMVVLSAILLLSFSLTYAYFSAVIAPQNPNDEIVTTGTLRLTL